MNKKNLSKRIFLGLTGQTSKEWMSKLSEVNRLGLDTVALFLECYKKTERQKIYQALLKSTIKNIPLIHIKDDMSKDEIEYLRGRYKNPYLTIHESDFKNLKRWNGFYKDLYLEMNYDDHLMNGVNVNKIGGFCIDLAHFKSAEEKWSKEFEYVINERKRKKLFKCNHLSGYSYTKNKDVHTVKKIEEFGYIKTLPSFVFGDVIALEVFNSISDQIIYRKYILNLLK